MTIHIPKADLIAQRDKVEQYYLEHIVDNEQGDITAQKLKTVFIHITELLDYLINNDGANVDHIGDLVNSTIKGSKTNLQRMKGPLAAEYFKAGKMSLGQLDVFTNSHSLMTYNPRSDITTSLPYVVVDKITGSKECRFDSYGSLLDNPDDLPDGYAEDFKQVFTYHRIIEDDFLLTGGYHYFAPGTDIDASFKLDLIDYDTGMYIYRHDVKDGPLVPSGNRFKGGANVIELNRPIMLHQGLRMKVILTYIEPVRVICLPQPDAILGGVSILVPKVSYIGYPVTPKVLPTVQSLTNIVGNMDVLAEELKTVTPHVIPVIAEDGKSLDDSPIVYNPIPTGGSIIDVSASLNAETLSIGRIAAIKATGASLITAHKRNSKRDIVVSSSYDPKSGSVGIFVPTIGAESIIKLNSNLVEAKSELPVPVIFELPLDYLLNVLTFRPTEPVVYGITIKLLIPEAEEAETYRTTVAVIDEETGKPMQVELGFGIVIPKGAKVIISISNGAVFCSTSTNQVDDVLFGKGNVPVLSLAIQPHKERLINNEAEPLFESVIANVDAVENNVTYMPNTSSKSILLKVDTSEIEHLPNLFIVKDVYKTWSKTNVVKVDVGIDKLTLTGADSDEVLIFILNYDSTYQNYEYNVYNQTHYLISLKVN